MKSSVSDILKQIYLFSFMDQGELEKLTQICSIHHYKKGSYLFMQGDISEHLLILVEGLVSVFKHDEKGNEILIGLFQPFSLLAEPAILKGVPFPSTAMFKTDGSVIKVELEQFRTLFLHDPHISHEIIQSLLDKIQLLQRNIHLNIASSAKEKIIYFYEKNNDIAITLKNYEIASLLAITPETFSRNAKVLCKEGKLVKTGRGYAISS